MKTFWKKLETLMSAVTFAEAGEHRTALEILKEGNGRTAGTERPVRASFPGGIVARPAAGK